LPDSFIGFVPETLLISKISKCSLLKPDGITGYKSFVPSKFIGIASCSNKLIIGVQYSEKSDFVNLISFGKERLNSKNNVNFLVLNLPK
jgi:hypothetical protein